MNFPPPSSLPNSTIPPTTSTPRRPMCPTNPNLTISLPPATLELDHNGDPKSPQSPVSPHSLDWDSAVSSPRAKGTTSTTRTWARSLCVFPRLCVSCCAFQAKRIHRGRPKRPTWNRKMETTIGALRAVSLSVPRQITHFRFFVDWRNSDARLCAGAIRCKTHVKSVLLDWVWPSSYRPALIPASPSQKRAKHMLSPEDILDISETKPVLIYLHGGAFAASSSRNCRTTLSFFATAGDMLAVAPDYTRVPEGTVVDAVNDCVTTFDYLVNTIGVPASRILLAGDSAGGSLAVLTMARIRENGWKMPGCAVLISPWTDLDDPYLLGEFLKWERKERKSVLPPYDFLPIDAMIAIAREIAKDLGPRNPKICSMYADVSDFPPLLIQAGEVELLRPQIERFAAKCSTAGLDVTAQVITDMIHIGQLYFRDCSPIAAKAMKDILAFMETHVAHQKKEENAEKE